MCYLMQEKSNNVNSLAKNEIALLSLKIKMLLDPTIHESAGWSKFTMIDENI